MSAMPAARPLLPSSGVSNGGPTAAAGQRGSSGVSSAQSAAAYAIARPANHTSSMPGAGGGGQGWSSSSGGGGGSGHLRPPLHVSRPSPSAAQLAAAAAMVGSTVPTHLSVSKDDTDGYEMSDSEMEDSVVLRDGRRFPNAIKEKHVSLMQLLAIVYFCVVGGPYGLEDAVMAGGLSWVVVLLLVLPWTLNLPIGLLTSELASAMPQNGGYIVWVSRAFGNFWAHMEGWFSWSSSLFDTALYPFLIAAYCNHFLLAYCNASLGYWSLYGVRIALCLVVMALNLFNVQMQGTIALVFAFVCLLPFAALTVLGFPEIQWAESVSDFTPIGEVNVGLMLSAVLWVCSGWDSPGTVAGDVKTPKKTYPRAVTIAVFLVMLTNLLPVLVAFSIEKPLNAYVSGHAFWALVAYHVGGSWLQLLVIVVAVLANLNLLHVLLTSSSWSLYALALPGLLDVPLLTKLQGRFRTPWVCITINTAGLLLCCLSTFAQLIQVTMALNGLALILQCMSLVWLRISAPRMKRPYRIPLGSMGVAAFMFMPMAISTLLLVTIEHGAQLIVAGFTAAGVVAFLLARLVERVHQQDSGLRPPVVDLQEVFEDVGESVESKPDDSFPDLGFRSSLLVEQLPESIRSDPTEVNDNVGDLDHNDAQAVNGQEHDEMDDEAEDEEDDEVTDTIHVSTSYTHSADDSARYGSTDLRRVTE